MAIRINENQNTPIISNNETQSPQQTQQTQTTTHSAINERPDSGRDSRLQGQFSQSRTNIDAQRVLGQINQGLNNPTNTDDYRPIRNASVSNIPMAADVVDRRLSNLVSNRPARNMPATADLVSRSNSPREATKTISLSAQPNSQIRDLQSVSSTIDVADDVNISQVKVNIDIAHTYQGDLVVKLRSPEGKEVTLHNRTGGSADNLVFEANPADFNGLSSKGAWSVVVEDKANQDTGTFKSWNLSITGEPKNVPPPTGGTITKTATPNAAVKDNQTTTSFIDITDEGQIENLKVNLDIAHTYQGDLVVKLKSPSGKEVVLHNKTGGSTDNLQLDLDRTEFANEPIKGRWTLTVEDTARQDEGVLKSWGLALKTKGTTPPPPPPPPQQGREVVVAVFDGGVDYNHTDLDGNMWVNRREVAGDGIDNDNNGVVDDVFGINTSNNTGDPFKGSGTDHGTHVAGIIAAEDNGTGTTGVAAKSNVKIMSVGGMYDGAGTRDLLDNFEAGVNYVVKMKEQGVNVRVINCSFAKIYDDPASQARWNAALDKLAAADIMLVASGGNTGRNVNDLNRFPNNARQPNILTVAALDTTGGKLASFSSFGDRVVELAAPGEKILSTVPGNKYEEFDGTSMAAPHVAAAASILFSKYPTMTAVQAREIILSTVELDPDLEGKVSTKGKLDIAAAVAKADAMFGA
ncbi:MAG: proprotein convertase P-domain-containing protein [Acidobacteria bacterium]|nr:proprotein convertase P-domain-containing protein [Acidobacteriota bacterium]